MFIDYGDYYFEDSNNADTGTYTANTYNGNDKNVGPFDSEKFNNLLNNRQYMDAVEYANKYHFRDAKKQDELENALANIKREGRRLSWQWQNTPDEAKALVDFSDKIFTQGGIRSMNEGKSYGEQFNSYVRNIGGENRSKLIVVFGPEKRKLFDVDWLDWALKDNQFNIKNFYKDTGFNEAYLKSKGVEVINKDGATMLKFDKGNELAGQILYNIPRDTGLFNLGNNEYLEKLQDSFTGKKLQDSIGRKLPIPGTGSGIGFVLENFFRSSHFGNAVIMGAYNENNGVDEEPSMWNANYENNLYEIYRLVEKGKEAKRKYFSKLDDDERTYSSTYIPFTLNIEGVKTREQQTKYVVDKLAGIGVNEYEMYTNEGNKNGDNTLNYVNPENRQGVLTGIMAAGADNLSFNYQITNGEIGLLVTVHPVETTKKDVTLGDIISDRAKNNLYQVFIPGFMTDEAQKAINNDTSIMTSQQINEMKDYGYPYDTNNGDNIQYIGNDKFIVNGEEKNTDEVFRLLHKDIIIDRGIKSFKYDFINTLNEPFNLDVADNRAKILAIQAANELWPNIPFTDGIKDLTISEVFDKMGVGYIPKREEAANMTREQYEKYCDVFEFYYRMINDLKTFNR